MSHTLANRLSRFAFMGVMAVILALGSGGSACLRKSPSGVTRAHIPPQETARAQYEVAFNQERQAKGLYDERSRRQELGVAIEAYREVGRRFPNDSEFTPAAHLKIGDLLRELGRHQDAVNQYNTLLSRYPNESGLRIGGLFGMGRSLDALNRFPEAEAYYRLLTDEYGDQLADPTIRTLVELSNRRLREIKFMSD